MHTELTIDNLKRTDERPSRERLATQMQAVLSGVTPSDTEAVSSDISQEPVQSSSITATPSTQQSDVAAEPLAEPPQAPKRKSGIVTGFRDAKQEYLELVWKDLELPIDKSRLHLLQYFFREYRRDPSVAELYFLSAAHNTYASDGVASITIGEVVCDDADFQELFRNMIRRYIYESGNDKVSPLFTTLAEFAATGRALYADTGLFISLKSEPVFPDIYDGGEDVIDIGDYYLTISAGNKLSGSDSFGYGVLLCPSADESADDFFRKALPVCREYLEKHPTRKVIKCTQKGLVRDLMDTLSGALIDTRLLPHSPTVADVVWKNFAPSVIIFAPRDELGELYSIATSRGVSVSSPIAAQADVITVNAAEGSVSLRAKSLIRLDYPVYRNISVPFPKFNGDGVSLDIETESIVSSAMSTSLCVSRVCGACLYEKLVSVFEGKSSSAFAITGTLDLSDEELISSVITLDSARRNIKPNVIYSKFFIGEKTEFTIIELSQK